MPGCAHPMFISVMHENGSHPGSDVGGNSSRGASTSLLYEQFELGQKTSVTTLSEIRMTAPRFVPHFGQSLRPFWNAVRESMGEVPL